jgi:hypothetical protein
VRRVAGPPRRDPRPHAGVYRHRLPVCHYYIYPLIQGQAIISYLSDPLGWGWDLFGTAGYETRVGVAGVAFAWYSRVALIVGGHVAAVHLAPLVSLRLLGSPKVVLRGQVPKLALVILYTLCSLWILSWPIVESRS